MRKWFLLLVVLLGVIALSGCNSSDTPEILWRDLTAIPVTATAAPGESMILWLSFAGTIQSVGYYTQPVKPGLPYPKARIDFTVKSHDEYPSELTITNTGEFVGEFWFYITASNSLKTERGRKLVTFTE